MRIFYDPGGLNFVIFVEMWLSDNLTKVKVAD